MLKEQLIKDKLYKFVRKPSQKNKQSKPNYLKHQTS